MLEMMSPASAILLLTLCSGVLYVWVWEVCSRCVGAERESDHSTSPCLLCSSSLLPPHSKQIQQSNKSNSKSMQHTKKRKEHSSGGSHHKGKAPFKPHPGINQSFIPPMNVSASYLHELLVVSPSFFSVWFGCGLICQLCTNLCAVSLFSDLFLFTPSAHPYALMLCQTSHPHLPHTRAPTPLFSSALAVTTRTFHSFPPL